MTRLKQSKAHREISDDERVSAALTVARGYNPYFHDFAFDLLDFAPIRSWVTDKDCLGWSILRLDPPRVAAD